MERNTKKILRQYLLLALIMVVMIESVVSLSYGDEDKKIRYGFSIFAGTGDVFYDKPDMRVYGFLPRISLPLLKIEELGFRIRRKLFLL